MDYQAEMTISSIEQWAAASASRTALMNGMDQFDRRAINDAENELLKLVSMEHIRGNQPLEEIFQNALNAIRRLYQ